MATFPELKAETTGWEYTGEIPALGSLQLTMLAKSFGNIEIGGLADLFPDRNVPERTIVIEQIIEGMGIMPIVRMGVPAGSFAENQRVRSFRVSPTLVREDDFLDQGLINQLRKAGTYNDQYMPEQIIADRVRQMVNRHTRTVDFMRAQCLLGGINYTDPRTNTTIAVSTNIPAHNFFSYKGYDLGGGAAPAIGASINGTPYTVGSTFVDKGRNEALLFTDVNNRAGIPWTDPNADIVRALRYIKQFLWNTNKNRYTRLYMSSELYTILHENNNIKAYAGGIGLFGAVNNTTIHTTASGTNAYPGSVSFGGDGELKYLAGCEVRVLDGLYRDPVDNVVKKYWPNHKVALVAPYHYQDSSATLGFTHHCVGESPNGTPGLWMRTGPEQMPPSPPGVTMQMGDAFLPFAVYPHWIAMLDVCEPEYITDNLVIDSMITYGTF